MPKFQSKYRPSSTRLQNWDYGWNAMYFITICTAHRVCYFCDDIDKIRDTGFCVNSLSEIGKIARQYWSEIPSHFPFVKLNAFVVMPNHVHGIIIIEKPFVGKNWTSIDGSNFIPGDQSNSVCNVETQNFASLQHMTTQIPDASQTIIDLLNHPKNKFGPQSENLASIIRGYKTGVKKYATLNNIDFAWQPRYHEHIIQDIKSYDRIRKYIIDNPDNWVNDDFHRK